MRQVLQVVIVVVLGAVGYWRYSTQIDRVKGLLEEEDYTEIDLQRAYKGSTILNITEQCTDEDEIYFTFSGMKNKKMYKGDLCCEDIFFIYESCDILSAKPVNSSQ